MAIPARQQVVARSGSTFLSVAFPMSVPEIAVTANGPAIVHAGDYSLGTAENPAKAGETLTLFACGIGPTRPSVDSGMPFPANPLAQANSPVEATVNGVPAGVLYAGGYPGTVNFYQVNFTLPSDVKPGPGSLRLTVAWIAGPEAVISIR